MKLMTSLAMVIKSHAALDSTLQFLDAEDVCYSEGCPTAGQILALHALHNQYYQLLVWYQGIKASAAREKEVPGGLQAELPVSWPCALKTSDGHLPVHG